MVGFIARIIGLFTCLVTLLSIVPVKAEPFFVRVYGRTYKVDPRYSVEEPKGPKPQEAMKALPSDIAKGPGFKPSHEQVLAEVEERMWIVRNQLDDELEKTPASRERLNTGQDSKEIRQDITGSLTPGAAQSRSPESQTLYDRHLALNLLARELRRSMNLPIRPGAGFSRPNLSPEIEASYRELNFDPLAAYDSFRRIKAAFRSGDIKLLARVAHFPLTITGRVRRTVRNREQLVAARQMIMDPHVRAVVAKATFETVFVRDKGMMLGEGEAWITRDKTGFGLGAINLE